MNENDESDDESDPDMPPLTRRSEDPESDSEAETDDATQLDNNDETNSSSTVHLMQQISLLESDLTNERTRNVQLSSTIKKERLSFSARLAKVEARIARDADTTYMTPPSKRTKTPPPYKSLQKVPLTPEQRDRISINRAAARQIRIRKLTEKQKLVEAGREY